MKKLLIFTFSFIVMSCKGHILQNEFTNKIWHIDYIKTGDNSKPELIILNYVMIPTKDGSMLPYRNQYSWFKRYKIQNDTIFIERENNSEGYEYMPYRYEKISEYISQLISLDKSDNYRIIYLTDLTNLFDGTLNNTKSALYNKIKQYSWYPIQEGFGENISYSERYPKHHLKQKAFYINDDSIFFPMGKLGDKYKFTDNTIYMVDKDNTLYIDQIFRVSFYDDKDLECMKFSSIMCANTSGYLSGLDIIYKKIDSYILVDENLLSEKDRFGCNEKQAMHTLNEIAL